MSPWMLGKVFQAHVVWIDGQKVIEPLERPGGDLLNYEAIVFLCLELDL